MCSSDLLTGVKVLTRTEITKVDRVEKTVEALNLYTGRTMVYDYDKLVIASGADSKRLQIPGSHKNGVHFLHTCLLYTSVAIGIKSGAKIRIFAVDSIRQPRISKIRFRISSITNLLSVMAAIPAETVSAR